METDTSGFRLSANAPEGQQRFPISLILPATHSFDKAPVQGINFYRLKQLDQDGRFLHSAVIDVVIEEDATRFAAIQHP